MDETDSLARCWLVKIPEPACLGKSVCLNKPGAACLAGRLFRASKHIKRGPEEAPQTNTVVTGVCVTFSRVSFAVLQGNQKDNQPIWSPLKTDTPISSDYVPQVAWPKPCWKKEQVPATTCLLARVPTERKRKRGVRIGIGGLLANMDQCPPCVSEGDPCYLLQFRAK